MNFHHQLLWHLPRCGRPLLVPCHGTALGAAAASSNQYRQGARMARRRGLLFQAANTGRSQWLGRPHGLDRFSILRRGQPKLVFWATGERPRSVVGVGKAWSGQHALFTFFLCRMKEMLLSHESSKASNSQCNQPQILIAFQICIPPPRNTPLISLIRPS